MTLASTSYRILSSAERCRYGNLAKELSAKLLVQKVYDSLEASMGEPPPTETMLSAPDCLNASTSARIPEIGECSPML